MSHIPKTYQIEVIKTFGYENQTDKHNFLNDQIMQRLYYYKPPIEFGPTMANNFPHAEVGRYPTDINMIGGVKNSVELYEEHKKELRELIDSVLYTLSIS